VNFYTIYYRKGRVIYRIDHGSSNPRPIRLATARTRIGAAMAVKALRAHPREHDPVWRKYL
jgi:hypothetical protein